MLEAMAASLAVSAILLQATTGSRIPQVVHQEERPWQGDRWISAVEAERRLRAEPLAKPAAGRMTAVDQFRLMDKDSSEYRVHGCIRWWVDHCNVAQPANLDELMSKTDRVLEGVVAEALPGFYFDEPGMLLRLSLVPEAGKAKPQKDILLFYPGGRFELDGYRICAQNPAFPEPPKVGQRVLLAAAGEPEGTERFVFSNFQAVFVEGEDGRLYASTAWSPFLSRGETLDSFKAQLSNSDLLSRQ